MKNAILEEISLNWENMAAMEENAKPGRSETLRECADLLRMAADNPLFSERETGLEELVRSACAIADRKGAGTAWGRFVASARSFGLNGVTARTYRILPSDIEGGSEPVATVAAPLPAAPAPTEQAGELPPLPFDFGLTGDDADRAIAYAAALAARPAPTEAPKEPNAWAVMEGGKILQLSPTKDICDDWLQYSAARSVVPLFFARQTPDSRDAALEEAARICDAQALEPECPERATYCADAIRALKGPAQ